MKINIRKISIIIVSLTLALSTPIVKAESGVTLTKKTYIKAYGRTEAKFYTNKGYAYCITPQKTGAGQGHIFSYSNTENDGGLMYLLNKAGSSDSEYLTTQLAIWKYKSNFMPTAFKGTQYDTNSNKLVNEAKNNSNYAGNTVSISAAINKHSMNLTNDGKYYKSSFITVKEKGSNQYKVKVTGSNYVQIITSNGKIISNNSNINSQEKVAIRIPAANLTSVTKINVTMTACGSKYIVKRYSPNNSKLQDIVLIDKENICVNTSLALNATPIKRTCEIYNGKYYDKDGKVTNKVTYEQQCQTNICKQVGDKYFDKNGKVTDQLTYQQQCQTNICKQVGDKYFDKNGKATDQITYQQQCQTNICKQVGDKYFDNEGNIVSESDYKAKCEAITITVPDTGTDTAKVILSIILGILIISGTIIIIKKYNSNI